MFLDLEGDTMPGAGKGNRRPTPLMQAGAKIINVGLDDLLVRAWATDFNKLRGRSMITADTSVFLPELARRLKSEKKLSDLKDDIGRRRADWGKIYEDKKPGCKKNWQTNGTRSRFR